MLVSSKTECSTVVNTVSNDDDNDHDHVLCLFFSFTQRCNVSRIPKVHLEKSATAGPQRTSRQQTADGDA